MAITISPAEINDIKPLVRLNVAAFTWMYSNILFDGPLKDSTIDALAEQRINSLYKKDEKSESEETPAKEFFGFKAVDDSTGEIVGEARWMIYYEDEVLTKSIEDEVEDRINPPMPQMQVQPTAEFARILSTTKRDVLAVPSDSEETTGSSAPIKLRKRVYLHVLAVHPNHQKKGIGRKLLQWGLDEADRLGLIAYLEASSDGVRLYEQAGFEKVKDVTMDLRPFGAKSNLPIRVS
jgi:GNAT superfamily N-acetyltransferase